MRQILWIFQKDVRHLRYSIAVTWAIQAAYGWLNVRSSPLNTLEVGRINALAGLSALLLVLAWWFLIALAVQDEALPGDKQFWLTRPYVRRNLVAAKLLFVFAIICVPWFVADCAILAAERLPVAGSLGPILLRQVACYVLFLLPAALLAVVTAGVRQFAMAWFLLLLGLIGISMALSRGGGVSMNIGLGWTSEWVGRIVALLAAAAFMNWVYASRRVNVGRVVLGAAAAWIFFGPSVPIPSRRVVNRRTPMAINTSGIQLAYREQNGEHRAGSSTNIRGQSAVEVYVGLTATGLPPEVEISGLESHMTYQPVAGEFRTFEPGWGVLKYDQGYWQVITLPDKQYRALKAERLTLRTSLRLTAFTTTVTKRIAGSEAGFVRIGDLGDCRVDRANVGLFCKAGVWQAQHTRVVLKQPGLAPLSAEMGQNFESLYPLIVGLSPVNKWFVSFARSTNVPTTSVDAPEASVELSPKKPLGEFRRTLVLRDVRLEDYVPPE